MRSIINLILSFATVVVCLSSCYNESEVHSTLAEDVEAPQDSKDPFDHFVYQFYTKYNTIIKYRYEPLDYQWNVSSLASTSYQPQTDKYILDEAMEYIAVVLERCYDQSFKERYFPPYIYLAARIDRSQGLTDIEDEIAYFGMSHIALGRINKGISKLSAEELRTMKGVVNSELWGGYLYANNKLNVPESFYNVSQKYYEINLKNLPENKPNPITSIESRKYGFWRKSPMFDEQYYFMGPNKRDDLREYFKMITSHSKTEIMELMKGYPLMVEKYNILTTYVKESFGIDIQSVGEK